MRVYGSNAIRNVAFVGHGAAARRRLVDALAFVSGSSRRHGTIQEGTTLTDYSADEIDRKHSISLGLGFAEWMDTKINLLDAPGYLDFFGEATAALHSADSAVVVLNATGGVEVGTEKVWEVCDRLHLPRLIFVTQMDREHADFERVFDDVRAHLSPKVVPVEIPMGNGADFHGIVNLFTGEDPALQEGHQDRRVRRPVPLPDDVKEHLRQIPRTAGGGDRRDRRHAAREIPGRRGTLPCRDRQALKKGVLAGEIVPMLVGSSTLTYGTRALLNEMVELLPSPAEVRRARRRRRRRPPSRPRLQDHLRAPRRRRNPVPAVPRRR